MQQLHNLELWMQWWWGWLLLFLLLLLLLLQNQLLLLIGNNADINVINIVHAVFRLEFHTADRADLDDVVLDVANEQLHGFTGTERRVANGTQAIHRNAGCIFEPAAAQILPYFSVLKHGVRVSQVKPSNCFQLHPTSMISKHRNIYRENLFTKVLQAPRKSSFTFHFDASLSSLVMWKLQSYPTAVLNERMWHFGGWNMLWHLLHIFGVKTPNPHRIYTLQILATVHHSEFSNVFFSGKPTGPL